MAQQKGVKEFNRLYDNLNELFRRIFDTAKDYPVKTCAEWFVDHLNTILSSKDYRAMLTEDKVKNIMNMINKLKRSDALDLIAKNGLEYSIIQLKEIKNNLKGNTIFK